MSLTAIADHSAVFGKDESEKVFPLCINCGKLADQEATRYRRVRAIGFQHIFRGAVRNHKNVLAYVFAKSVFSAWKLQTKLVRNRKVSVDRVEKIKTFSRMLEMFNMWRRKANTRKVQILKDQVYDLEGYIEATTST